MKVKKLQMYHSNFKGYEMEKSSQDSNRNISLDIARGIGIIFVVICHIRYSFMTTYIYWFHMPLFFIISGFLFQRSNSNNKDNLILKLCEKTCKFLVPYVSFYLSILIVLRIDTCSWPLIMAEDLKLLLKGGVHLVGAFGPFWFITVLYFTQIAFLFITRYLSVKIGIITVMSCYILSHLSVFRNITIWDANVTLYSLFFFGVGYLKAAYPLRKKVENRIIIVSIIIVVLSIGLQAFGVMNYRLDMKHASYDSWILDMVIPSCFSLFILTVSEVLQKTKIGEGFAFIGKYTLPIMYLHIPVSYLILNHFEFQNMSIIQIVASIIFPVLLSRFVFEKFAITRKMYLGAFHIS